MLHRNEEFNRALSEHVKPKDFATPEEFEAAAQSFLEEYNRGAAVDLLDTDEARAFDLYCEACDALETRNTPDEKSIERAIGLCKEAILLDGHCYDARLLLIDIYKDTGRTDNDGLESLLELEKQAQDYCIERGGFTAADMGRAWHNLYMRPYLRIKQAIAETYLDQGRYRLALQACEELIAFSSDDPQGMRYLALWLYVWLEEEDHALEIYARAGRPDNAWFLLGLSVLYFKLDKLDLAHEFLTRLAKTIPHAVDFLLDGFEGIENKMQRGLYQPGTPEELYLACEDGYFVLMTTPAYLDWVEAVEG